MNEKICSACKETKPIGEFWARRASKDGLDHKCGNCAKKYHRDLYHNSEKRQKDIRRNNDTHKAKLRGWRKEIYEGQGCVDCGNTDPRVFEFDHVRGEKEFDIATAFAKAYSMERITKEISKCDLVCANCHRIRTYERRLSDKTASTQPVTRPV